MEKKKDYIPGAPAGSQGPQFESFDFAYESDQIQKMAMQSEQANLADINKQIAATDKELARLAGRVVPAQGRSAKSVAKSADYENKIINTKRFLESERAEVVKALEAKTESLPKSYSTASEEKNVIKKSIEGPPVITTATEVDPPKYTAVIDEKGAAVMGTRPAPPSEPEKPKATPTGNITRQPSTIKTIVGDDGELISYKSPGSLNYPEIQVGTTASSKPIMSTGPASDYFKGRMAMSDQEVLEKYEKLGADYESKLVQEQIDQAKYEFDFNKGEIIQTTGDEFERVSSQEMYVRSSGRPNQVVVPANEANKAIERRAAMTPEERRRADAVEAKQIASDKKAKAVLAKQDADVRKTGNKRLIDTGVYNYTPGVPSPDAKIKDVNVPGVVKSAAAAKIAQAAKKLGGKTNMLNIPIMTKGSADKIFRDFFGKQDYSS
tara:strand:+ start:371 stop:1681 length:1311 start_codon:yes stop_codon:yes gene_type:complete